MTTKFVIVEPINFGRSFRAIPKLSFATREEAEQAIIAKFNEKYRSRFHVESRSVKDVDASQTMHCQCCGRAIHAALGSIAHHGYQRPGHGWQTPSCFGAKRLPWEVDRGALADLIEYLERLLKRSTEQRAGVAAETHPVTISYSGDYDRSTGRTKQESVTVMRETFDAAVKIDPRINRGRYGDDATFDAYKKRDLRSRDQEIVNLRRDIKEFSARYASWKQTHKWNGKLWEAI